MGSSLARVLLTAVVLMVHSQSRAVDYFGHYAHSHQSGFYGSNEVNIVAVDAFDTTDIDANAAAGIKSYVANLFSDFFMPRTGYPCVFASQPANGFDAWLTQTLGANRVKDVGAVYFDEPYYKLYGSAQCGTNTAQITQYISDVAGYIKSETAAKLPHAPPVTVAMDDVYYAVDGTYGVTRFPANVDWIGIEYYPCNGSLPSNWIQTFNGYLSSLLQKIDLQRQKIFLIPQAFSGAGFICDNEVQLNALADGFRGVLSTSNTPNILPYTVAVLPFLAGGDENLVSGIEKYQSVRANYTRFAQQYVIPIRTAAMRPIANALAADVAGPTTGAVLP